MTAMVSLISYHQTMLSSGSLHFIRDQVIYQSAYTSYCFFKGQKKILFKHPVSVQGVLKLKQKIQKYSSMVQIKCMYLLRRVKAFLVLDHNKAIDFELHIKP